MFEKKEFLGVGVTDESVDKVLEYIEKKLLKSTRKHFIITLNPEILVLANKNFEYKKVLNSSILALIDGIGLIWGGKILGKEFKHKVTGVDFVKSLCFYVAEKPITVGFLGASAGIAEKTAECLREKYPSLRIVFVGQEWSTSGFRDNNAKVEGRKSSSIDILFVAFGAPKQEEWIYKNLDKIPVKIAMGVGGSFDYISGKVERAPLFIRRLGFEWLYRLIRQPWRLKRQLRLLEFTYLILKEKAKI